MLRTHLCVVGRGLVRVLPVTQPRNPLVSDRTVLGKAFGLALGSGSPFDLLPEPIRDRRVIRGGPPERGERQPATGRLGDLSFVLEGRQYLAVELGRRDNRNGAEVLRRGPQHRGASYVNLLDGLFFGSAASDGLLEGIEVDADEIYRAYVLLDELLYVVGVSEIGQDAAVDPGVQRLDPPSENLRRARHLGDGDDCDPGLGESPRGATGRDDLEPHPGEPPRELLDSALVRNRDQGPPLHTSTLPM